MFSNSKGKMAQKLLWRTHIQAVTTLRSNFAKKDIGLRFSFHCTTDPHYPGQRKKANIYLKLNNSWTDPTLSTRFTKFEKFTRSTRISRIARFTTTIFSIQFPPESSHACDNFDLFVNTFHNIYKSSMPSSLISTFVARMSRAQVHVRLYSGKLKIFQCSPQPSCSRHKGRHPNYKNFSIQFPPESLHACDNFDIYKSSMPSSLISTFVARMSRAQVHVRLYSGKL